MDIIKTTYRYLLPFITAFFLLLISAKTTSIFQASKGYWVDGVGYYGHWSGFWIYLATLIVLHFINFKFNKQPFFFDKDNGLIMLLYLFNLAWLVILIFATRATISAMS